MYCDMNYSGVLLLLILLTSCGNSTDGAVAETTEEPSAPAIAPGTIEVDNASSAVTYFTIVDELRMREEPSTESRVITKLALGEQLVYLNEQSKEQLTVKLQGTTVQGNWKKVSVDPQGNGKTITGWVFGGALKEEVANYRNVKDDQYVRDINFLPGKVVRRVIGLDLETTYTYKGQIGYRKSLGGDYVKNGKFFLTGEAKITELGEDSNQRLIVRYTGEYLDGKEQGLFERKLNGLENTNVAQIFFENGRCLWSEIKGEGEGEPYEFREENPGSCTFGYLEKGLQ